MKNIPFRSTSNIGLGVMFLLIIIIGFFSYQTMESISVKLIKFLQVETEKYYKWQALNDKIHNSVEHFREFQIGISEDISAALADAEEAINIVRDLSVFFPSETDTVLIKTLLKDCKSFRQAVFVYSMEVHEGFRGGTSAKEMEDVAKLTASRVLQTINHSMEDISGKIKSKYSATILEINQSLKTLFYILIFAFLLTILNSIFMKRALDKPVHQLADASRAVAGGDLTQKVMITTKDEFGYLANSFNSMVRELEESRAELVDKEYIDAIISNMTDILIVVDLQALIKTVNKATLDLLGYKSEELVGKPFKKVLKETSSGARESTVDDMAELDSRSEFEKHYKTKTGEIIPVNFSISPLKDKKGRIVGFVSIARDMREINKYFESERKLVAATAAAEASKKRAKELQEAYGGLEQSKEAALNIMEDLDQQTKKLQTEIVQRKKTENELNKMYQEVQLLANLVENAHEMVFVLKPDGSILKSNLMSRDVFGYSAQEMSERKIMDILKSGADLHWKGIIKHVLEKLYWRGDLTAVCRDERSFPANVAISRPAEKEKAIEAGNLLCFVRDVTHEKRIDRMKSEFISTVSHELRTPLSITREGISLIKDRIPGEINRNQERLIDTAMDNIDRLARIINDLLDVSKIEAGRLEIRRKIIDISGLLKQVFVSFEPKAKSKALELRSDLPKRKIEIYADEDKINQVFVNLIGNAIKFTEKGYIKIILVEKEDEVDCIVADTGMGILKEDMPKLFGKFQQFGRVAGPGEKGTGLGLSIVKDIIEMHGGRIEVHSTLNKETIFTISIPKYTIFNILKDHIRDGIKEAASKYSSFSLVSVNILNFNKIEEIMSSDKADGIFRELTDGVRQLLRRTCDMLVEDHSDIFILLPDTDRKGALVVLSRIRQTFENYITTHRDVTELKELRFNFSTINYPEEAKTYENFITRTKETKNGKENSVHRG